MVQWQATFLTRLSCIAPPTCITTLPPPGALKRLLVDNKTFGRGIDNRIVIQRGNQFFFNVGTTPTQGESSHPWYNLGGINATMDFVVLLTRRTDVSPANLGIMSMYKDDITMIKDRLDGFYGVEVLHFDLTTVARFQGREKKMMILRFVAVSLLVLSYY